MNKILTPYTKDHFSLKNHLVMAPMTRSRAVDNIPNDLMTEYYAQRTGAGLIVTEGTAPMPEGLGYPRIPGIFSKDQVAGWMKTTAAVHSGGSRIFLQLMHTGRIGHYDNLPDGARLVGVSTIKAAGRIFTDNGGSIEARGKIVVELAAAIAGAIGKKKVGIRFSPFNILGDLPLYPEDEVHETYRYLAGELEKAGITYIHLAANARIPRKTFDAIRAAFSGAIILCNGLTPETAEKALHDGFADLVAFGRSFIANPDLDKRIAADAPLAQPDIATLYTPGAKGYTDYPTLDEQLVPKI